MTKREKTVDASGGTRHVETPTVGSDDHARFGIVSVPHYTTFPRLSTPRCGHSVGQTPRVSLANGWRRWTGPPRPVCYDAAAGRRASGEKHPADPGEGMVASGGAMPGESLRTEERR